MASAELVNFDYNVISGSLGLISDAAEEVTAQNIELRTNMGEWFLGTSFGYPWIVKDREGNNAGILGTAHDAEFTAALLSEKLLASAGVRSIESIDLKFSQGVLTGEIRETLINGKEQELDALVNNVVLFSFGGDQ